MEALEVVQELVVMLVVQEIRLPLIRLKEMMVVVVDLLLDNVQLVAVEQEELVQHLVVVLSVQEE
jgi:hypothetical protein